MSSIVESESFLIMGSIRISWLLIFTLSFLFNNHSEARHEKKLPSAVVVGTVYCDTCFQQDFTKSSHFISDASVAVECGDGNLKPSFYKEVKTNKHGEFKVQLPFAVSKHVKRIKSCSVKLISSSELFCAVASMATSSSLHLKSRKQGIHIFSAGFFTFKPLKQPELCNQNPSLEASKKHSSMKTFLSEPVKPPKSLPPTIKNSGFLILPPLPPLPNLPPLPTLPPLPLMPPLPVFPLPPNTFQPPPLLPPIQFQAPPLSINPPPIPGLTPPPPRTTIPSPFPPIQFPPSFPGTLPTSSKKISP